LQPRHPLSTPCRNDHRAMNHGPDCQTVRSATPTLPCRHHQRGQHQFPMPTQRQYPGLSRQDRATSTAPDGDAAETYRLPRLRPARQPLSFDAQNDPCHNPLPSGESATTDFGQKCDLCQAFVGQKDKLCPPFLGNALVAPTPTSHPAARRGVSPQGHERHRNGLRPAHSCGPALFWNYASASLPDGRQAPRPSSRCPFTGGQNLSGRPRSVSHMVGLDASTARTPANRPTRILRR